jgi:transcriptional regulator with XRE-family HTH domain/tetratricopeptide (TPR) repeat protein
MRELRRAAGLSLVSLADRTGGDRRRLGEIESGYAVPAPELLARIDRILNAHCQLTELLDSVVTEHHQSLQVAHASRRRRRKLQQAQRGVGEDIRLGWESGEPLLRRDFIKGMGAAAVGATLLGHLPAFSPAPETTAGDLPAVLAALTANYRQLDNLAGPASVQRTSIEHYHRIVRYLEGAGTDTGYRALAVVGAETAELAGWLAFDTERYGDAARWCRRSAELAKVGNNMGLHAYALGRMSRMLSHCGEHHHALSFAEQADAVGKRSASPRTRSWLKATRAYVHACLGDASRCLKDLDEARRLLSLDEQTKDEPWLDFYSQAHLAKWEGHCRLKLGEAEPAREVFQRTLAGWNPASVRERAEVTGALADALIHEREIPQASELVGQAYQVALATGSARNQRAITALRTTLEPWANEPCIRQLDDRMLAARSAHATQA